MLWAAFYVGFFGFMRLEEFTLCYDGLSVDNIAINFDSWLHPLIMTILLRRIEQNQSLWGGHPAVLGEDRKQTLPYLSGVGLLGNLPTHCRLPYLYSRMGPH